jgi:hypothetical protein
LDGHGALSMEVGGSDSIIATVHVPAGALAGWYPISGTLVDDAGRMTPVVLNAAVEMVFSLAIESPAPAQNGTLGEKLLFSLTITNLGNGNDTIGFMWAGLPKDWPGPEFVLPGGQQGGGIRLGPSERANVTVEFRIPTVTPVDNATIIIYAGSNGGIGFGTNLSIHVQKADLVITRVEPASRNFRAGVPVLVNVTVANRGEVAAAGVELEYSLDGRRVSAVTVGLLRAGGEAVQMFKVVPREGSNALRFVADPGDAVCESNETNNAASLVEIAAMKKDTAPGVSFVQVAVALVAVILIGLLLVVVLRRRRPKQPPNLNVGK